jgi:hypothetical protein
MGPGRQNDPGIPAGVFSFCEPLDYHFVRLGAFLLAGNLVAR